MGARSRWASASIAVLTFCSCITLPFGASAQNLQARFFTPKSTYLVGEPIFVTFEIVNKGNKPVWIDSRLGDPCFEQPPVTVENANRNWHIWKTALACGPFGYGGSCFSSETEIKPNQSHSGRVFVNHYYQLDQPGICVIRIDWTIPVSDGPIPSAPFATAKLMGDITVRVVRGAEWELKAAFQPVLKGLTGTNFERRSQNLQAVTDLAQPFFEQTILDLSKNLGDVWAAIEGLYKINTPQARNRLAHLAEHGNEDGIRERAMRALAALGYTEYLPVFFHLARTRKGYEQVVAIESSGLLGGDKAVPLLLNFLRSPDSLVRGAAVIGLAGTASRKAIGPLIQETRDPGASVRQNAGFALTQLTHRSVSQDASSVNANAGLIYQKWLNWWLTLGRNAPIYGPTECAEPTPLN